MFSNYYFLELLGATIIFPAVAGIWRFKKIHVSYRPFIFFIWAGLLHDIIAFILVYYIKNNAVSSNIYVFIEVIFLLWLFDSWSGGNRKKIFGILLSILFITWCVDNLVLNSLFRFNSVYRVAYSFLIVYLSIDRINRILVEERKNIFRNAMFIICVAFVLFYSYRATLEVFYIVRPKLSNEFYSGLFHIMVVINFFSNILYGIAVLWIPTKRKYTPQY